MKLTLYYSVVNGGDGSAYPVFFDTKELADFDQDHLDEGWGEPCVGKITIHGDNLTTVCSMSAIKYYFELLDNGWGSRDASILKEFVVAFFPTGLPDFVVRCTPDPKYYSVLSEGREVYKIFSHPGDTTEDKADLLYERLRTGIVNGTQDGQEDNNE